MTRTGSRTLCALGILVTLLSFSRDGAAQFGRDRDDRGRNGRDRVCFYKDSQFQGWEQCYQVGDEIADLGGRKNAISSFRIMGRARVVVYDQRGFQGDSDEFSSDVADLEFRNRSGSKSWNDRIESIRILPDGRGGFGGIFRPQNRDDRDDRDDRNGSIGRGREGVCVYDQPNFRGRSTCWEAGQDERNLNRLEGWNDRIRSIRVYGRARARVYRDAGYRGERLEIDHDMRDLGNWSNQISSIEVR